jgi:gliding motility-associated protein GldC
MKESEIQFNVLLDENNIPEQIKWNATDKPRDAEEKCKGISISLWDNTGTGTMRIDLWVKEMPIEEMKRFCIESIAAWADTILNATGDEFMAKKIDDLCQNLVNYLKNGNEF